MISLSERSKTPPKMYNAIYIKLYKTQTNL